MASHEETGQPSIEGVCRLLGHAGTRPSTTRSGTPRQTEERSARGVRPQVAVPQRLRRGAGMKRQCRTMVNGDLVEQLEVRLQDVIDSYQPGMWREYIADLVAAKTRIVWYEEFHRLYALMAVALQAWWVTHPTEFRKHLQEFGKLSRLRDKERVSPPGQVAVLLALQDDLATVVDDSKLQRWHSNIKQAAKKARNQETGLDETATHP